MLGSYLRLLVVMGRANWLCGGSLVPWCPGALVPWCPGALVHLLTNTSSADGTLSSIYTLGRLYMGQHCSKGSKVGPKDKLNVLCLYTVADNHWELDIQTQTENHKKISTMSFFLRIWVYISKNPKVSLCFSNPFSSSLLLRHLFADGTFSLTRPLLLLRHLFADGAFLSPLP